MNGNKDIEKAVGRYLEEVAARLGEMPADEKDDVLRDIESHIYAALEKSGPAPTLDDLNVILAGMDRPSAYAPSLPEGASEAGGPRVCPFALAGSVAAVLAAAIVAWILSIWANTPFNETGIAAICSAALVLPLATAALGLISVSRIRVSKGRLVGMPLAVSLSLFYPLALSDALIIGLTMLALGLLQEGFIARGSMARSQLLIMFPILIIVSVAVIVADVKIARRVWRWATRKVGHGEFT